MNKKQQKEKQLLENIDKAAAGEKLPEESGLDKDTKAALEMTREMAAWPKSPSKEFKAQLKADLTHRVVEQQKKDLAKQGDPEYRNFLRRPAWQFTFAGLGALIVAGIIWLIVFFINR
jgi:hypothetical protein